LPIGTISSAIQELKPQDHLCLIYNSPEEHLAGAAMFIKCGLENRERCLYVVDDSTSEAVNAVLERSGVSVADARASHSLEIVTKREAYLRDGYFSPERMINFLREQTEKAQRDGFGALRLAAEMTWALGDAAGVDRLLEYEARLNHFFEDHACLAACQYNRQRFSAETVRGVIHTHPIVAVGHTVARNHFYVPPSEYLESGSHRPDIEIDRMLRQLTALEQAQEALVRSEKLALAGRMAASVAHEINNPLEAIVNLLFLAQHANSVAESREYVQQAQGELTRLGHITRQTLGFYREQSGPMRIPVTEIVEEVAMVMKPKLLRKKAKFKPEIGPGLKVVANYGELRQILINLVSNAIDAVSADGEVRVMAHGDGGFIAIEIADNGTGIAPENLARIFEPFFSTKASHGTGLGLWVVQDLAARQGGTITVQSHTEGDQKGTTFTLLLPAARS
jgi:signal transduction histidine kinase